MRENSNRYYGEIPNISATEVTKTFDIVKLVAKTRFWFHANMTSVVNVANQLGVLKDDVADRMNEEHFFECMDALQRLGYDVEGYFKKMSKNE